MTVDWINGLLYWTDSRRRTIVVSSYDGTMRRTLAINGLMSPRGIVVDPVNGYKLYFLSDRALSRHVTVDS